MAVKSCVPWDRSYCPWDGEAIYENELAGQSQRDEAKGSSFDSTSYILKSFLEVVRFVVPKNQPMGNHGDPCRPLAHGALRFLAYFLGRRTFLFEKHQGVNFRFANVFPRRFLGKR